MIYRDDDVSKYTDLTTIMKIHELFVLYNKVHTVTLLMEDLWESKGIWYWLMTAPNIDIALHGWGHSDYSKMTYDEIRENLLKCVIYWESNIVRGGWKYKKLTTFYPPWNKVSDDLRRVCEVCDLKINDCVDASKVYNFHWWTCITQKGLNELEEVLKND